jgi:Leishmanolysin
MGNRILSVVALGGMLAVVAACSTSTEAPVPTSMVSSPTGPFTFTSVNQTQQFTGTVQDQNGVTIPNTPVSWTSNNTAAVTISTVGVATAHANGTATLTATGPGLTTAVTATVAQAASVINKTGGDGQSGLTSQPLGNQLSVRVTDAGATAMVGVAVSFAITSGGGSVSPASVNTDGSGNATTTWTLGASGGSQQATASAGSAPAAVFSATALAAGQAASVFGIAGLGQSALVGYAVNVRPAVRVVDAIGNPVVGQMVTFAVTGVGGSVTGANAVTNAAGNAQVGSWTVGASPATYTLTATVTGSGISGNPVGFTANGVNSTFNITLQNTGPALAPEVQTAFDSAVAKWQRIIISDLPNISGISGTCGGTAFGPVNVDDVLILLRLDSIDGPGQILGQAGPCYIRTQGNLTIVGTMMFDTADIRTLINTGSLNAVILHEMGHVLGFGSLWGPTLFNCLQNPSTGAPPTVVSLDTYYSCPSARAEFDSIGGTNYTGGNKVPIENCAGITSCGAGTYNSHWRESTFFNELMTGYLNTGLGVVNPLSRMTIAQMEDLGYTVNYAAADAYARTFTAPPALTAAASAQRTELGDDIYKGPLFAVDQAGHITAIIRH